MPPSTAPNLLPPHHAHLVGPGHAAQRLHLPLTLQRIDKHNVCPGISKGGGPPQRFIKRLCLAGVGAGDDEDVAALIPAGG
jgi:hypothetical protein